VRTCTAAALGQQKVLRVPGKFRTICALNRFNLQGSPKWRQRV
jgi:hypothetical protein